MTKPTPPPACGDVRRTTPAAGVAGRTQLISPPRPAAGVADPDAAPPWRHLHARIQADRLAADDEKLDERWQAIAAALVRHKVGEQDWSRLQNSSSVEVPVMLAAAAVFALCNLAYGLAEHRPVLLVVGAALTVISASFAALIGFSCWTSRPEGAAARTAGEDACRLVNGLNPAHITRPADPPIPEQGLADLLGEALLHLRLTPATAAEILDIADHLRSIARARTGPPSPGADGGHAALDAAAEALAPRVWALCPPELMSISQS